MKLYTSIGRIRNRLSAKIDARKQKKVRKQQAELLLEKTESHSFIRKELLVQVINEKAKKRIMTKLNLI